MALILTPCVKFIRWLRDNLICSYCKWITKERIRQYRNIYFCDNFFDSRRSWQKRGLRANTPPFSYSHEGEAHSFAPIFCLTLREKNYEKRKLLTKKMSMDSSFKHFRGSLLKSFISRSHLKVSRMIISFAFRKKA